MYNQEDFEVDDLDLDEFMAEDEDYKQQKPGLKNDKGSPSLQRSYHEVSQSNPSAVKN